MTTSSIDPTNLRLRAWDLLDERAQRSVADEIAARIGGRVLGLFEHESGSLRHRVATIERAGVELGLIPGGPVHLGWFSDAPLSLSAERLARWREECEVDLTFSAFIAPSLTPARVIEIAPFLIELAPKLIADWVEDLDDGEPLAAIAARVCRDGFRLPTDDEWEHAVRAGGTTFFRWGDEWPDGIPYGHETTFVGHRRLNAFGLSITHDPYQSEVVDSPLGFRAGDGGAAVCGGRPPPEAWISFASAFRPPRDTWEDVVIETLECGWIRRAMSIP